MDRIIPAMDEGVFYTERILRVPQGRRIDFLRRGIDLSWLIFLYAEIFLLGLLFVIFLSK